MTTLLFNLKNQLSNTPSKKKSHSFLVIMKQKILKKYSQVLLNNLDLNNYPLSKKLMILKEKLKKKKLMKHPN